MNFFVAKLRFAQNPWFELKLHKFFHSFALDQGFWSLLVNCDAEFVFSGEKERVLFWRKFEPEFLEQRPELVRVLLREWMRVGIQILNVQLPTLNVQSSFSIQTLDVGR